MAQETARCSIAKGVPVAPCCRVRVEVAVAVRRDEMARAARSKTVSTVGLQAGSAIPGFLVFVMLKGVLSGRGSEVVELAKTIVTN